MNKSFFRGNLTRDPETRTISNGDSVTSFSLAINKRWKDKNGEAKESVVFPNFDLWGASGRTFAEYHKKGDQALVTAEYTQNTTGEGDERKTFHGFKVLEWEFVSGRSNGNGGNGQKKVEEKDEEVFDEPKKETKQRGRPVKAKVVEEDDTDSIPF